MFDYLINVVMLKVHEGRSSKVRIRKRADPLRHFVLTPHYEETDMKQTSV